MASSAPDARPIPSPPALERLLGRDDAIVLAGVVVLCALAWLYLLTGAGLGMSAWDATTLALFPHQQAMAPMPGMTTAAPAWTAATWALVIGMWWTMMIAMMAPSAAPTILLHAHVHRQARAQGQLHDARAPSGRFVAGYLLAWLVFAVVAATLQWSLERAGVVAAMTMGTRSAWLSAAVLLAAGAYQFSPLQHACLAHCRAPAAFLSRYWRPGRWNALRLGALHGAFCVGCCGLLMALLFVGGVMNLAWIAALALLVLAEKVLPMGRWVGTAAGVVLVAWGTATLLS